LDEVADMSLAMQAKLLRVLQEGEVRPVGSSKKVKIDVRLVTASTGTSNAWWPREIPPGSFLPDQRV
jgi:transcriptional regulator with PAS, ATPase and Fis domain